MHVAQWPAEWTSDLIDVLSILTRLITLEEAQLLLLLDAVLADYLIDHRQGRPVV
jgi:hypothetical protein